MLRPARSFGISTSFPSADQTSNHRKENGQRPVNTYSQHGYYLCGMTVVTRTSPGAPRCRPAGRPRAVFVEIK